MNDANEQRHVVNKTYDEIRVGDFASLTRTLMPEDVKLFAVLTGDFNPATAESSYSESGMFREVMAHGMWSGSLISTVLGTQFPGPGTILIDETPAFRAAGDASATRSPSP
jgi:phosphate acetyltransferase